MDPSKLIKAYVQSSGLLIPHIDKYQSEAIFPDLWTILLENYKEQDDYFHPSSDCLLSPRELFFLKTGAVKPDPIGVPLRRAFDAGKMWHSYFEEILISMGFVDRENVERVHQTKIKTELGTAICKGTVDLLNVAIPHHGDWLIDLKTMSKFSFSSPPEYLMEKYIAQINVYGDWFQTENLMILGICKDSPHALREIIVQPDGELVEEIYNRWTFTSHCIQSKTVPPDE